MPPDRTKKEKKREPKQKVVSMTDFLDYLQEFHNDFLDSAILDKFLVDVQEEEKIRALLLREKEQEEDERREKEEKTRMESQRRGDMLEFHEGQWNPRVVEYLDEFNKEDL